jgi:hypothetical protein
MTEPEPEWSEVLTPVEWINRELNEGRKAEAVWFVALWPEPKRSEYLGAISLWVQESLATGRRDFEVIELMNAMPEDWRPPFREIWAQAMAARKKASA